MIGTAKLNFDELRTVLCEVENASNSRPLTHMSPDNHEEALTPYHLLYGRNINACYIDSGLLSYPSAEKLSSKVTHLKTVIEHFMKRFQMEYITNLREFHRYHASGNVAEINVGDMVLLKENSPRMMWKKALVTKLLKGSDGITRGVEIKTRTKSGEPSSLRRPIQHLVPLEVKRHNEENNIELRPKRAAALTGDLIRKLTNVERYTKS